MIADGGVKQAQGRSTSISGAEAEGPSAVTTHARIVDGSPVRIWGLTPAERLRRSLAAAGVASISEGVATLPADGNIVILRGDRVYDDALVKGLLDCPGAVLVVREGGDTRPVAAHIAAADAPRALDSLARGAAPPEGLERLTPDDLAAAYRGNLRKRESPFCFRVTPETRPVVERRLFAASYKGVTDVVTKYVWPEPALWATRLAVRLGLSPNAVTLLSAVLVVLAFVWFADGRYAEGLVAAWIMTFLDTVDGKLARVTLTSSRFGNVFDHGIDLVHPPFWYVAWGLGLAEANAPLPEGWLAVALAVICGGYVLGRLIEGAFIWRFGIELHIWRPFDSFFRLIIARRNPNLVLLTAAWAAGRPDVGLMAVAAWTVLSNLEQIVRFVQAEARRRRGIGLVSWLAGPA